jgi:hypothetical protein
MADVGPHAPDPRYAHLAAELQSLDRDAVRLWGDADERHRALEAILDAWETGSPDLERTIAAFRGFEEGMVEGLTRHVTRDRAGMSLPDMSYDYYVRAYQTLAPELGIAVEQLWRELWQHPTGAVRSAFGGTVETVYRSTTGQAMTASQRARLGGVADRLFSAVPSNDCPDPRVLAAIWRTVFQ